MSKMDADKKKRTAVAYLLTHMDEVPEGSEKLFAKLKQLEKSANENVKAYKGAEQAMQQLQEQMSGIIGATNAVVEIVCEGLPEDKVGEWCDKYQPPQMQQRQQAQPKPEPDLAGSTAKTLPPIAPPKQ